MHRMFMTVISSIILATMVKINYKLCLVAEIYIYIYIYILQLQYRSTKNFVIYVILQTFKLNFRVQFHNIAIDITVKG